MTGVPGVLGVGLREQLGEILVRTGRLAHGELPRAVMEARARSMKLGQYLVDAGLVTEEDIAEALAEQYGLRYVAVDLRMLDPSLASLIPEALARKMDVLPLNARDGHVSIAVADPTDVLVADGLRMALPQDVELCVATPSMIQRGMATIYSTGPHVVEEDVTPGGQEDRRQSTIDVSDSDMAPAVEAVNQFLRRAIDLGASDVHFLPRKDDLLVRARVDGVMRDVGTVNTSLRNAVIARLKVMGQLDIAERRLPQDGRASISVGGVDMDLRVAVLPAARGEEVVLRIAYIGRQGVRTLDELQLDENTSSILRHALHRPSGAIIVAGPTGAGKTSTLYAALAALNDGTRTIVSIEDPVENLVDGVVQVEVNARAGLTFGRGLRTILRADPDVILVGEIRDSETAEIALHAAMTGHLVLSTLHAESAAAAIVRLRELGASEGSIGSGIRCVMSQRLLRRPCQRCGRDQRLGAEDLSRVGLPPHLELYRPRGCVACGNTGYAGRIGVYEALEIDEDIRAVLGESAITIRGVGAAAGAVSLFANAQRLAASGATTVDEVLRVCGEVDEHLGAGQNVARLAAAV